MEAFGVDLSRHQGHVDFDVMAQHENPRVEFVAVRAGISWGYQDDWFAHNWIEAKRINRLRTAYHVLYPGEPILSQMDNFFRILGDDIGELKLVEDWELVHSQSKYTITKAILSCDEIIERRTGRHLILYSRANLLNSYTYFSELKHLDLWLAQYLSEPFPANEHPGPPALPTGATTWKLHQTGDHTPGAGFGVESLQLDYDRFNGDVAALYDYAEVPIVPELTLESLDRRLYAVECKLGIL